MWCADEASRQVFQILEDMWQVYSAQASVRAEKSGLCKKTPGCCLRENHGIDLHDPSVCGYNLNEFVINSRGCRRSEFPLSKEGGRLKYADRSEADCEKRRSMKIGHNARSGLWIYTCMIHQRIVGHHVIKDSEGKRDIVMPLYEFMKTAPAVVFVDFACQAEESSLNWLGEFFRHTRWYHDTFHGYAHKCSSRFSCKGLHDIPDANTSMMEQANSFLQPLRGLLKSGTTRVSSINVKLHKNVICVYMLFI